MPTWLEHLRPFLEHDSVLVLGAITAVVVRWIRWLGPPGGRP